MNAPVRSSAIPFDAARLDRLMDEAGIDVLVATSKHNVQYLLGGHRAFFFDYMDAMGVSRYLPIVIYPKGAPDKAAFFGHRLENFQREINPFWMPTQMANCSGSLDTTQKAVDHIKKSGVKANSIGVETAFLPMDAGSALQERVPGIRHQGRAVRAGAHARDQDAGRAREAQGRLGGGARLHEGGDRQSRSRRHQGGADRGAAPRGDQPRPDLRILPDHRRHQPQPRAVRSGVGRGRHPLARLRRQLSRLHRRHLPHGDPRRARRRACRTCWATSRRSSAPR